MNHRILRLWVSILLALLLSPLQAAMQNQLKGHPSPYLAMHGKDPVHWQIFGKAALERARSENKLLYISSGYFSCHWCHVMQRESYSDPGIAALLNRYFIPIKVDRELQPALDAQLIDFVQSTRGHAGWPLNVFLTPEGYPLFGMTYEPRQRFAALLEKLRTAWGKDEERLRGLARKAAADLASSDTPIGTPTPSPEQLGEGLVATAMRLADDMEGGFGRQNRFPMAPQLSVLLDTLGPRPDPKLRQVLELTLDQMATQGLRDQLAGGFFRYTVDPGWQTPHFEKMLYTQAQMIQLYIQAARQLQRPDYLQVARDTLDFVLREMAGEDGAYIASFSAVDAKGVEGGDYLWSEQQLEQVLTPGELVLARQRWGLDPAPDHGAGALPVQAMSLQALARVTHKDVAELTKTLAGIADKLRQARAGRHPPRDDKRLAAWNGLLLSALVTAARQFDEPRYRQAAERLRDYLVGSLWDGKRLLRARSEQGALGDAVLEDYVYVAAALAALDGLRGDERDEPLVQRLVQQAWARFFSSGGWRGSDAPLLPNQPLEPAIADGPLPSPAALLIELTRNRVDRAEALDLAALRRRALQLSYASIGEQPFWYASHVRAVIDAGGTAAPKS